MTSSDFVIRYSFGFLVSLFGFLLTWFRHSDLRSEVSVSEKPSSDRDRSFADSGWGIKPDDQPANAADARAEDARKIYRYRADEPDVIRRVLRAQRKGFNTANRVRVEGARTV